MMKNIVFSLALLGALTETGPAFAESKSLPDCAVTSAKSHGVELTLYRALMIHELGRRLLERLARSTRLLQPILRHP